MVSVNTAVPGSWNRYGYALADPINRRDRSGLNVFSAIVHALQDLFGGDLSLDPEMDDSG
jgi:hypothetical protein